MAAQSTRAGVVTCPDCDLSVPIDDPNEAIELHRRHASVTAHSVVWKSVGIDAAVSEADVTGALYELEDAYPDGVPFGTLTASLADHGISIGETLEIVSDLRMDGKIYEPRDDHILSV
ncbi:hypothetical protein [Halobellus rubicundus]|uniref:Uncharacterized protein n=1 Tax=Halobellus rubicundus TaxID=2996466 RepID=A0ABD5MER3_9EURY